GLQISADALVTHGYQCRRAECETVIEARSHSRRRGSWTSERPSPDSRVIQIGSWCETMTPSASGPYRASLVRRLAIAARMRSTICRYGSPQDGVSGLYR